jgi:hypothetical protein
LISLILTISCTLSRIGVPQKAVEMQPPRKVVNEVEFTFIVNPVNISTEIVTLEFRIENKSTEVKRLTFNTAQKYDFWAVNSSGDEVWRWSRDKSFLQVVEEVQMPIAAKIAFIESFDVKGIPSGIYTVHGEILVSPTSISLSDQFEIKK